VKGLKAREEIDPAVIYKPTNPQHAGRERGKERGGEVEVGDAATKCLRRRKWVGGREIWTRRRRDGMGLRSIGMKREKTTKGWERRRCR
jgi:hypothetical protein